MKLIVGLGNPGKKYQNSRHNIGWIVLEALAKELKLGEWRLEKRSRAWVIKTKDLILAKPNTFMNNSGIVVRELTAACLMTTKSSATAQNFGEFSNLTTEILSANLSSLPNLWVVHDDIDLPLEKIKIVKNRGSAGHQGVVSIIKSLGTIDFVRFRLGIGHPHSGRRYQGEKKATKFDDQGETEDFVLAPFLATEKDELRKMIKKTVKALQLGREKGIEAAMNRFN